MRHATSPVPHSNSSKASTSVSYPVGQLNLNPVEQVWGIIKVLVRKNPPQKNKELYTRLCDVWAAITDEQINKMVGSFLERCRMVLALDGRSASQHLSSHRSVELLEPPPSTWDEAHDQSLAIGQLRKPFEVPHGSKTSQGCYLVLNMS